MIVLENSHLKISIKTKGAELTSVFFKENNTEYLWQGNPDFWGRQSPVLFPFVGRLKNNTFYIEGKSYEQSQHGFARDSDFELVEDTGTQKTFELNSSSETLEIFPYRFTLQIIYKLYEKTLLVSYKIVNTDKETIYFSFGAHPAFNCPLFNSSSFSDYYIEFEKEETVNQLFLNKENGLIRTEKKKLEKIRKIPLNYDLFSNDALIFEKITSKSVSLKSTKHSNGIKLFAENWDYFAFWTKKNASFICFEPWMGIADFENTNQVFKEKVGVKSLSVGNAFTANYKVTVF